MRVKFICASFTQCVTSETLYCSPWRSLLLSYQALIQILKLVVRRILNDDAATLSSGLQRDTCTQRSTKFSFERLQLRILRPRRMMCPRRLRHAANQLFSLTDGEVI